MAVGEVVGHSSIKSAARMNGAVVIFVDEIEKVNKVIKTGIVVNDTFVSVSPLNTPAKRVIISNIPPFISDDVLLRELSRHGKIVSPIRKLPSGCKSLLLKHVVSHRQQVHMILNKKDEELNLVFNLKADKSEYIVSVTSGTLKCFGCGREGHLIRACPEKASSDDKTQREETRGETQKPTKDGEGTKKTQQRQENNEAGKDTQSEAPISQKENETSNNSEEAEGEQTVLNSADGTAQDTVRDSDEDLTEEEENVFKVPVLKRKQINDNSGSQAKKGPVTRSREGQQEE